MKNCTLHVSSKAPKKNKIWRALSPYSTRDVQGFIFHIADDFEIVKSKVVIVKHTL